MKKIMSFITAVTMSLPMVTSFNVSATENDAPPVYNTFVQYTDEDFILDDSIKEFLEDYSVNDEIGARIFEEYGQDKREIEVRGADKAYYLGVVKKNQAYCDVYLAINYVKLGIDFAYDQALYFDSYRVGFDMLSCAGWSHCDDAEEEMEQYIKWEDIICGPDCEEKDKLLEVEKKRDEFVLLSGDEKAQLWFNNEPYIGMVRPNVTEERLGSFQIGVEMSVMNTRHPDFANYMDKLTGVFAEMSYRDFKALGITVDDAIRMTRLLIAGDANEDGEISISDSIAVMQSIANPDVYPLTLQGQLNADLDGNGITAKDALLIQQKLLAR